MDYYFVFATNFTILVEHFEHDPVIIFRPFLAVASLGATIADLALHLTQYPVSAGIYLLVTVVDKKVFGVSQYVQVVLCPPVEVGTIL